MHVFKTKDLPVIGGAEILETSEEGIKLLLPENDGGIDLTGLLPCKERFLVTTLMVDENHCLPFHFLVWPKGSEDRADGLTLRFGLTPGFKLKVCIDLEWLKGNTLFPEHAPLQHKVVCHGQRVPWDKAGKVVFTHRECYHPVKVFFGNITMTDVPPEADEFPLPDIKMIDEMGQLMTKDWAGKVKSLDELGDKYRKVLELPDAYPFADWDEWGGWKEKKLTEGTGYFSTCKKDGRWWLVDPDGYAYICHGPTGVRLGAAARIDQVKPLLSWLPERTPETEEFYGPDRAFWRIEGPWKPEHFSFEKANLARVLGEGWKDTWAALMSRQLKNAGLNCLGNSPDLDFAAKAKIPYCIQLRHFPETRLKLFRDFPDVLSPEYREESRATAEQLKEFAGDPYLIGYFMRNEPAWAFVPNLVVADEVLRNPAPSYCRTELIRTLKEKYNTVEALSAAWSTSFTDWSDLEGPIENASTLSEAASEDMHAFSRVLLREYVQAPAKACRAVDPHHLNLGMRWAWISNRDLVSGWENFDVFSVNCYGFDPLAIIEQVRKNDVDLPVMIGEFHFGSLESGLNSTGLKAVTSQKERGVAYRRYVELGAADPNGVSFHYFQCYDQFALGRFDGENYNIGLFNVCSLPYEDMFAAIRETSGRLYEVASGKVEPFSREAKSIPVIGF